MLTGTVQVSVPLDNTNPTSGVERLIQIGSQLDITTLAAAPAIGPRQHDDERSVRDRARRAFSDRQLQQLRGLATALGADLNGSTAVIDLAAGGQYDSAKNTFTATRMVVLLSN